jgi:hypothetical protein
MGNSYFLPFENPPFPEALKKEIHKIQPREMYHDPSPEISSTILFQRYKLNINIRFISCIFKNWVDKHPRGLADWVTKWYNMNRSPLSLWVREEYLDHKQFMNNHVGKIPIAPPMTTNVAPYDIPLTWSDVVRRASKCPLPQNY